jgi:CDP-glucose 4,6-dehydratase
MLGPDPAYWNGRRVLLTGHTGFKGSWLALWLLELGAEVTGLALPAATDPSLFAQLGLDQRLDHRVGDIRDADLLRDLVLETQPEVVLHLAAQPLVRLSYQEPVATWATNVMGTIHVLEALRLLDRPCSAVLITTDKVYRNNEWVYGYRENDPLGGHDPYSASKAAADLMTQSWRRSFFPPGRVATVRAGNVIGGGDYAVDRIVPDIIRSSFAGVPVQIRNPESTRPWQHVLDCLSGYLEVGARLDGSPDFPEAFNFGPGPDGNRSVREVIAEFNRHWGIAWEKVGSEPQLAEASLLNLTIDRACARLGWRPVWNFEDSVQRTAAWYALRHTGTDPNLVDVSRTQILEYGQAARTARAAWATRPS